MKKYAALIEYDGASYHGWQLQKDDPTIQGAVEAALEKILKTPVRVHGAGRTDAGVHASGQTASFEVDWKHEAQDLQRACNSLLPHDITIHAIREVSNDFHARYSARSKTYEYTIFNSPLRSSLKRHYSWHYHHSLDMGMMDKAAKRLIGVKDFASFGTPPKEGGSTVREITAAGWMHAAAEGMLLFRISGTGFLKYMVRSIVGTLVLVGSGKINLFEFLEILDSCDRSKAGPTAPPHGLCLVNVKYDFGDIQKGV